MKKKIMTTTIFVLMAAALLLTLTGFSSDGKKSGITDAERALAMWDVQNVMSKHSYYHAAGMHLEELEEIWVDEEGPNAATASFSSPNWIMQGYSTVKENYGQANQDNKVKELEAVSKLYPEVENIPENLGAGHEYAMHLNTTPIIEIAGDGQTAKGIWYSPGIGLSAQINGTSVNTGGTFFWEKYGADFVKEDGEWKMWHCQMYYDWTPRFPDSMTSNLAGGQGAMNEQKPQEGGAAPEGKGGPGEEGQKPQDGMEAGTQMTGDTAEGMKDNPVKYEPYSVTRVPTIAPQFPEPYYTFSETFSY